MLTFSVITVIVLLVGLAAYLSSALFGNQSSGMGPLPPHYKHLLPPTGPADSPQNDVAASVESTKATPR